MTTTIPHQLQLMRRVPRTKEETGPHRLRFKEYVPDGEDVLVAARNGGDRAEFQEHMRRFIQDFEQ
jgi:hypothetical protein